MVYAPAETLRHVRLMTMNPGRTRTTRDRGTTESRLFCSSQPSPGYLQQPLYTPADPRSVRCSDAAAAQAAAGLPGDAGGDGERRSGTFHPSAGALAGGWPGEAHHSARRQPGRLAVVGRLDAGRWVCFRVTALPDTRRLHGGRGGGAVPRSLPANLHHRGDVARIAALGFNVVRVPFNYRLLEDDERPYSYRDDGWSILDHLLDWSAPACLCGARPARGTRRAVRAVRRQPTGQGTAVDKCGGSAAHRRAMAGYRCTLS